jgi:uncharacterized protein YkwD
VRPVPSARRLLIAILLAVMAVPATAQAACRGADVPLSVSSLAQARHAVLCLHNNVRRTHGLRRLRENASLDRAARRHSRQMVRQGYFDHRSPAGSTLVSRARAAGYLRSAFAFTLGENIGWGEGELSTPRSMMRAWMLSPGHRANILRAGFRDLGIGLVAGTPVGTGGGTFTSDFGARS